MDWRNTYSAVNCGAAGGGGADCACPFSADSYCILAVIEWDGENPPVAIDLRLFLNDLDLKVLNAVTVSPQQGMGHFTEFGEALKYAKRFGITLLSISSNKSGLLSKKSINKPIIKIKELINFALSFFEKNNDPFQKEWSVFNKLFDIKNVSRKECLILPFRTLSKALKL